MGFSEKMRESLGAEGARVQVKAPDAIVGRGDIATAAITIGPRMGPAAAPPPETPCDGSGARGLDAAESDGGATAGGAWFGSG